MISKCARIERDGEIALVVVHNPPVNTITAEVRAGLGEALETIRSGENLRAVVLLCEGSTFFSGADIGEFAGPPREVEYRIAVQRLRGARGSRGGGHARHRDGRRPRDRARLPLPRGRADHAICLARSDARHHSRRGRHAAPAAAHRRGACAGIHSVGEAGRHVTGERPGFPRRRHRRRSARRRHRLRASVAGRGQGSRGAPAR